jgi:hypothetical protein
MFTYLEAPASDGSPEIGPPPYCHRSDCDICRQQDGLKTGSELLDGPRPPARTEEGSGGTSRNCLHGAGAVPSSALEQQN